MSSFAKRRLAAVLVGWNRASSGRIVARHVHESRLVSKRFRLSGSDWFGGDRLLVASAGVGVGVGVGWYWHSGDSAVVHAKAREVHADEVDETGEVSGPAEFNGQWKVGGGFRRMTPLKVKVYTIAMYARESADELSARLLSSKTASKWINASADDVMGDEEFWLHLLDSGGEITLLMTVVRSVGGKHMQQGFDRALIKRVRRADKEMNMPGGKAGLKKFNKVFTDLGTLPVGTKVAITFHPGRSALDVTVNGESKASIASPALSWALWDMFFASSSPASPEVKRSVADGLASVLALDSHATIAASPRG